MKYEDEKRQRKVVFYGRVSTEHEAQLSAFEAQMQWYDSLLEKHKSWSLVDRYTDRGITGTQAKKRPAFLKMVEDAKNLQNFDLIVTREVCRFARNTVDTLEYTRKLRKLGVEVYFVEDNIWSFDSDGELRLTIMAALAQEESRKDSERVRAGQKTSREKGTLYGSGNILGYDLHRNIDDAGKWNPAENTYIINPEQAETVKMIYDLYCYERLGFTKICKELERRKRKDACGKISWCASKVSRILHNKTYAGYKGYMKSYTQDYLEHSRVVNRDRSSYMYVKGDWEPIISEEQWELAQSIAAEKTRDRESYEKPTRGKRETDNIWLKKLRCSCGSTYCKNKWRQNKQSKENVYGYQCYSQLNKGSYGFRLKNGLDTEGYCSVRMVGEWKLEFMAYRIMKRLWTERESTVEEALNMILNSFVNDKTAVEKSIFSNLREQIEKGENRLKNLLEMRMDGEISSQQYIQLKQEEEIKISEYRHKLQEYGAEEDKKASLEETLEKISNTLQTYVDFSEGIVSHELLDRLLIRVTPMGEGRFRWYFNLSGGKVAGIDSCIKIFEEKLDFDEAYDYRKQNGAYLRKNQWYDLFVEVWVSI